MLLNESRNGIQFHPVEATGTFQGHGFQPELCHHVPTTHVDVGWLAPIQRYKEETIRAYSENRRHTMVILPHLCVPRHRALFLVARLHSLRIPDAGKKKRT